MEALALRTPMSSFSSKSVSQFLQTSHSQKHGDSSSPRWKTAILASNKSSLFPVCRVLSLKSQPTKANLRFHRAAWRSEEQREDGEETQKAKWRSEEQREEGEETQKAEWGSEQQRGGDEEEQNQKGFSAVAITRRCLLSSLLAVVPLLRGEPARATSYREYIDRFDGYIFSYPVGWIQVRGAGADVFFRDPVNLDENVVVDFSSPSSSRYKSIEDLGTPSQAAQKVLKQKITEFMSTRLGVRRESKIVSANSRVGDDGRLYYDIEVDVKSYANNNELAVMPADRVQKLEWSRRYLSTLGVENNRLYELRLQAPEKVLAKERTDLLQIMNSFQLVKLEV